MVRATPIPVDLDLDPVTVPEPAAAAAYYVAAEALTNVLKHAKATRITISPRRDTNWVRLLVQDNGCGGAAPSLGTGLTGLRDRVEAVGGRLSVRSQVNAGTSVEVVLP